MSTITNKIKNIFGVSNNTTYTSTGTNITTSNSTTGTIYTNTPGTSIYGSSSSVSTAGWNTLIGGSNNTASVAQNIHELSLNNSKLNHTYTGGEQFYQHEILVVRIHRDKDNKIIKSENISQYWIGSPNKENLEYKNLSVEDRPEVELIIRTLRTIQL